jgi:hypothetical protein
MNHITYKHLTTIEGLEIIRKHNATKTIPPLKGELIDSPSTIEIKDNGTETQQNKIKGVSTINT